MTLSIVENLANEWVLIYKEITILSALSFEQKEMKLLELHYRVEILKLQINQVK